MRNGFNRTSAIRESLQSHRQVLVFPGVKFGVFLMHLVLHLHFNLYERILMKAYLTQTLIRVLRVRDFYYEKNSSYQDKDHLLR